MGSSGRQRFMRKASISSSVGALTSSRLLYGLFLSSSCIIASICFIRLSSASSAWETEETDQEVDQSLRWAATRDMRPGLRAAIPSLVSPSSSLHSPNHCCQSGASCFSYSSFSSSSLLPSCLDASEDGASFHNWDLLHVQVISASSFKSNFCLLFLFFFCYCHLLPGGTWAVLPLLRFQVLLQTEHSPSCSWAKREREIQGNAFQEIPNDNNDCVWTVRPSTYHTNSSFSGAVTLFDHRAAALVSPEAIFPVGSPYTLWTAHLLWEMGPAMWQK